MQAFLWKRNLILPGIKMQRKPFLKTQCLLVTLHSHAEAYCDYFQFPQPLSLSLDVCLSGPQSQLRAVCVCRREVSFVYDRGQ